MEFLHQHPQLRRPFLIFSALVVIALLVTPVVVLYRHQIAGVADRYRDTLAVCENISNEDDCFAREQCEGVFQASSPTSKPAFVRCQEVPQKFVVQYELERPLCERTGGAWTKTKFGQMCSCDELGVVRIFDAERGCMVKP